MPKIKSLWKGEMRSLIVWDVRGSYIVIIRVLVGVDVFRVSRCGTLQNSNTRLSSSLPAPPTQRQRNERPMVLSMPTAVRGSC